jgi:RimJ/RimL family protein N-acetyltransferase
LTELTTDRLLLRQFKESDLDAHAAMCADPEVMRYVGEGHTMTRMEAWRNMAMILGHWQLRGYGTWAVEERATKEFVGRVGFMYPDGWPGLELGGVIGRSHWGRGFATEAGKAALKYAFGKLERDHVISLIHPENEASISVAKRLGETLEGETELFGQKVLIYGVRAP